MIVLAIISTLLAGIVTMFVFWANMADPAPTADSFQFMWMIRLAWVWSAVMWLSWAIIKWV